MVRERKGSLPEIPEILTEISQWFGEDYGCIDLQDGSVQNNAGETVGRLSARNYVEIHQSVFDPSAGNVGVSVYVGPKELVDLVEELLLKAEKAHLGIRMLVT